MIITIGEGASTYSPEQMWLLLAALTEHPEVNVVTRERGELAEECQRLNTKPQNEW